MIRILRQRIPHADRMARQAAGADPRRSQRDRRLCGMREAEDIAGHDAVMTAQAEQRAVVQFDTQRLIRPKRDEVLRSLIEQRSTADGDVWRMTGRAEVQRATVVLPKIVGAADEAARQKVLDFGHGCETRGCRLRIVLGNLALRRVIFRTRGDQGRDEDSDAEHGRQASRSGDCQSSWVSRRLHVPPNISSSKVAVKSPGITSVIEAVVPLDSVRP